MGIESIEPKELRLGNYLHLKIQGNLFVREVVGFSHKGVEVGMENLNNEKTDLTIKEEFPVRRELVPIPLMEEWIERFVIDKMRWLRIERNPISGGYNFDMLITTEDGNLKWLTLFPKLWSVHQLQNLYFALTGEELKLK